MSTAIARNSGELDVAGLDRIIMGRNMNYLLATRKAVTAKTRAVSSLALSDTGTWEVQRWFPEHELWLSFLGEYLVLRRNGRSVRELYRGTVQQEALEAYNGMEG